MIDLEDVQWTTDDFNVRFSLSFPGPGIIGIIGPSGGGKSTLLNIVAGFTDPQSGRIRINGHDVTGFAPSERPVSILFQEHNLFAHLDAAKNAALGLKPDLSLDKAEWREVDAALARLGLQGRETHRPAELSGGERQRVALARIFLRKKPILLLDEPFSGLGPRLRRDMLEVVRKLQQDLDLTVLMVSHDPDDLKAIASHAVFVADGTASTPQTIDRFFATPLQPRLANYL
ncbi:MAG: ATP-binding cassette domain-containing protein [Hyphomicrobiales bacterium]